MTKTKAIQGTRNAVAGKWVTVTSDTLGTRKNFKVFTKSVTDTICYLVYKAVEEDDVFTHFIKVDGQWITRDDVERALENLHEHVGVSKKMLQLFAINNMFNHLY